MSAVRDLTPDELEDRLDHLIECTSGALLAALKTLGEIGGSRAKLIEELHQTARAAREAAKALSALDDLEAATVLHLHEPTEAPS